MFVSRAFQANHEDLIHDVAFDFYGLRMATCSSDQKVKVWDLGPDGEWICTARWDCHLGSIWRVAWAHPEFGQVIATCSFDRTIAIWEEVSSSRSVTNPPTRDGPIVSSPKPFSSTWVKRANLVDPRTSVTGLQFAPRHMGLQLAAVSTDGLLRVYEAMDVMNLTQWRLQFDFGTRTHGACLAWSQSRFDPPLIAVGSATSPGVNMNGIVDASAQQPPAPPNSIGGNIGKLVIYEYNEPRRYWECIQDVAELEDPVHDVQFAPHMGQSHHTLAVGSKEVIILRVRPVARIGGPNRPPVTPNKTKSLKAEDGTLNASVNSFGSSAAAVRKSYEISLLARFDHHMGRVWRVSWNVTGSVLASSGDDGHVRLWQANHLGIWQPISVIAPDGSQPTMDVSMPPTTASTVLNLSSMLPSQTSSIIGQSAGLSSKITSGGLEESESTKPLVSACGTPAFQKSGTLAGDSFPVAWH